MKKQFFDSPAVGVPFPALPPPPHIPPLSSPAGSLVTLSLKTPPGSAPEAVFEDMRRNYIWRVVLSEVDIGFWEAEILLPLEPTLLRYHFILAGGSRIQERRQVDGGNIPTYGKWEAVDFQIAVYDPESLPPDWVQDAVIYQIFPDRFAQGFSPNRNRSSEIGANERHFLPWDALPEAPPKGKDFFGGDLKGILQRLDYLQDLGVNCLYLNPIFFSPSNHRYDALDYFQIDPLLGTMEDFRRLVEELHRRGMRLILDGVFNHCSEKSLYFREAQASRTSPYWRWFHFHQWPDHYVSWENFTHMPTLSESPEVKQFFFGPGGVTRHWLELGADGWRLDVAPSKSEGFWQVFGKTMRRHHPQAYLVAEDWENASRWFLGDTFHAAMNYRLGWAALGYLVFGTLSPSGLQERLETQRRDTPPPVFQAQFNLVDSHDTPRLATFCGEDGRRVRLVAAFQLAYPGAPCIYYGDEVGIAGDYAEDGRRPYPWNGGDSELREFYRTAIRARRESLALRRGSLQTVYVDDSTGGYAFLRQAGEEMVIAAFNPLDSPLQIKLELDTKVRSGRWRDLLGWTESLSGEDGLLYLTLPPRTAGWFRAPEPS